MHCDHQEDPDTNSDALEEPADLRRSRRQLGLPPQFGPLPERSRNMASATTASQTEQTTAPSAPWPFNALRTPKPFHGDAYEDVEDWLDQYDRVAVANEWDEHRKLRYVYFYLEDSARIWFENHEAALTTWPEFCTQLRNTYGSPDRKEQAERLLNSRNQRPNESVAMFVEEMSRLFRRADPAMAEDKKVRFLMRGVKEQLFAGLVRNPPATVAEFLREATTMERMLRQRSSQYERPNNLSCLSSALATPDVATIRDLAELVRSIVREELQKFRTVSHQPQVAALTDVVREEVRQLVQPLVAPPAEAPLLTYAEALRTPAPAVSYSPRPSTLQTPQYFSGPPHDQNPRLNVRKSSVWRAPDNRPLCYHCGEPGHLYRECSYRHMGLPGFRPDARRPRDGERPRAIAEYLASHQSPGLQRRQSRSPSPRRSTSPGQHSTFADVVAGRSPRSPSPRRGN